MKAKIRRVLTLPGVGTGAASTVGALQRSSARSAPRLEALYRKLPAADGLPYGVTQSAQVKALLDYYRRLDRQVAEAAWQPRFSILVPTYRPDHTYFAEMLASVGLQTYSDWQLCLVDDASGDPAIAEMVAAFAAQHPGRVAFETRAKNGHISATSNDCLRLADGDFIVLLDHDDRLYPQALAENVRAIDAHRGSDGRYPVVLYSDERIIDENGRPTGEVWLKPDWMPLLHLTSNYTNHLTVYSRELVEGLGGFRAGFDGSQDHDLMLRATEVSADRGLPVVHIPSVLYQWRSHDGSVVKNPEAKAYSIEPAMVAVTEACRRRGRPAAITREPDRTPNRINYQLPHPLPPVTVVVLDRGGDTEKCLRSVLDSAYPVESVVLLDQTEPERAAKAGAWHRIGPLTEAQAAIVRCLNTSETTEAAALMAVAEKLSTGFMAVVSDRLQVISADWLQAMVGLAQWPDAGLIAPLVLGSDWRVSSAGMVGAGADGVAPAMRGTDPLKPVYIEWTDSIHEVLAVPSDAFVVSAATLAEDGFDVGAFGESFYAADLCLRLRQVGRASIFTPYAVLRYQEDPEPTRLLGWERDALVRRWPLEMVADPYLNPDLARNGRFDVNPESMLPEIPSEVFASWLAQEAIG